MPVDREIAGLCVRVGGGRKTQTHKKCNNEPAVHNL